MNELGVDMYQLFP